MTIADIPTPFSAAAPDPAPAAPLLRAGWRVLPEPYDGKPQYTCRRDDAESEDGVVFWAFEQGSYGWRPWGDENRGHFGHSLESACIRAEALCPPAERAPLAGRAAGPVERLVPCARCGEEIPAGDDPRRLWVCSDDTACDERRAEQVAGGDDVRPTESRATLRAALRIEREQSAHLRALLAAERDDMFASRAALAAAETRHHAEARAAVERAEVAERERDAARRDANALESQLHDYEDECEDWQDTFKRMEAGYLDALELARLERDEARDDAAEYMRRMLLATTAAARAPLTPPAPVDARVREVENLRAAAAAAYDHLQYLVGENLSTSFTPTFSADLRRALAALDAAPPDGLVREPELRWQGRNAELEEANAALKAAVERAERFVETMRADAKLSRQCARSLRSEVDRGDCIRQSPESKLARAEVLESCAGKIVRALAALDATQPGSGGAAGERKETTDGNR